MPSTTLADRLLTSLKNNRYVAVAIVAASIVIAVAQFSGALRELRVLIWPDATGARATYQVLAFDLRTAEKALTDFTVVTLDPSNIQAQARLVLSAVDPVCAVKKSLAELGDAATRAEIDRFCSGIQSFRNLVDPQFLATGDFNARVLVIRGTAHVLAKHARELRGKLPA